MAQSKEKPWYADLIEKWGNKLTHAFYLGIIGMFAIGTPSEDTIKEEVKKTDKGGNLQSYVNAHTIAEDGYKTWVSTQLDKIAEEVNLNTTRRLREEGAESERDRHILTMSKTSKEYIDGIEY